jgi:hypothetical protein
MNPSRYVLFRSQIAPMMAPPMMSGFLFPGPGPCCTVVLLSISAALHQYFCHLETSLRPKCGDAVKAARKHVGCLPSATWQMCQFDEAFIPWPAAASVHHALTMRSRESSASDAELSLERAERRFLCQMTEETTSCGICYLADVSQTPAAHDADVPERSARERRGPRERFQHNTTASTRTVVRLFTPSLHATCQEWIAGASFYTGHDGWRAGLIPGQNANGERRD